MKAIHVFAVVVAVVLAGIAGFFAGERSAASTDRATGSAAIKDARNTPPAPAPSVATAPAMPAAASPRPVTAPVAAAPLPPLNAPVLSVLDDLRKQAAAGSTPAACRLAFELDRCRNQQRQQRVVANYANLAAQPGVGPELGRRYMQLAEREQQRVNETQRVCQGVPQDETGDAWRYLLQAARAGHGPSMARYATRRTLWDEDPVRVLDGLIAFRAEGPAFLQSAADMGIPEAYEQLAFSLASGVTGGLEIPVDRVRGLAYYLALMRTATPEENARLQRAVDYAMQKENISREELARARTLSEGLALPLLRRHPPGSVDFTGGTFAADNGSHCEK